MYIPYSAYLVKTVNCCQPIQAPLKFLIIIFIQTQQANISIWREIRRDMSEHAFGIMKLNV